MKEICCCDGCYKRDNCAGAFWYCTSCKKDPSSCELSKDNRGDPKKVDVDNNIESCSCRSC